MDMQSKSKKELVSICKENNIKGYSNKGKKDIIDLINSKIETNIKIKQENEIIEEKQQQNTPVVIDEKDVGDLYKSNLEFLKTMFGDCLLGQLNKKL